MARTTASVVAAVLASQHAVSDACSLIGVGADASATGYPLVAHTDDSGPGTTDVRFARVPRTKWGKGSTRPFHDWIPGYPRMVSSQRGPDYAPVNGQEESYVITTIPQVEETYAYWDLDYGIMNEKGLAMGESTCTAKTAGWPATPDKPYGYCHAGIEDLSKIGLERCATARCAVQLMGDVAVELGFYSADSGEPSKPDHSDSAESLIVVDTKEVWIFNVLTGKNNASAIWAAKRIPPGNVAAIGNSFTIRKIDFDDKDNYLYSPGVTELAEEMGWWSPSEGSFDFFKAYGYTIVPEGPNAEAMEYSKTVNSYYSGRRMWRIFSLLSPEEGAKLDPNRGNLPETKDPYPESVPAPKGSVTAEKIMSVLRDHYEGTPYDLTAGMAAGPFGTPNRGASVPRGTFGQWERAISMHRTSYSHICETRPNGRGIVWFGNDAPHGTAYLPFFANSAGPAPESFRSHEGMMSKFSTKVAWWAFNMVNQYIDLNYRLIQADVHEHSLKIEEEGRAMVTQCAEAADEAEAQHGEQAAREVLEACSTKFAEAKVAQWWEMGFSLFAKYGRYGITHNESSNGEGMQQYPEWWAKSQEVGYTLWSPHGPFHGIPEDVDLSAQVMQARVISPLAMCAAAFLAAAFTFKAGVRRGRKQAEANDQTAYMAAP